MNVYVDTSFAVSLFIEDENSERVATWMESFTARFVVSRWAVLEFISVAAVSIRQQQLRPEEGHAVRERFSAWVKQDCMVADMLDQHFTSAFELIQGDRAPLRAGDALHLAACFRWSCTMLTLDKGLIRAAEANNCPVIPIYDEA